MNSFYVFLDSRNKINGSNNSFQVSLDDFAVQYGMNVGVSLEQFTCYNTEYPVNSYNNSFTFRENAGVTDFTFSITPGNYSGSALATALKTAMDLAGANTYTVAFSSTTGCLTISVVAPDTFKITSVNAILGITAMTSFASAVVGSSPVNLSGVEYIDVLMNGLKSPNMTSNSNWNGFLQRVPLNSSWGGLIDYRSYESDDNIIVEHQILNNLRVELRRPDSNIFTLADNSYVSMVLRCTVQL